MRVPRSKERATSGAVFTSRRETNRDTGCRLGCVHADRSLFVSRGSVVAVLGARATVPWRDGLRGRSVVVGSGSD